ncbi:MAG: CoA-binding protein [Thermoplasmata archaeon]|nr:CoA-binding protein [Thermoplasmata archaeon]
MMTSDETTREILRNARTIAVVGLSDKPDRDSNRAARYLLSQGYTIVPVNPNLSEVLGLRAYPSVSAIPTGQPIDIVDIFRRNDQVAPIVDEAIGRGVPTIWMQLGVQNEAAAASAREHGIQVYQDLCIMQEHRRLRVGPLRT